MPSRDEVIKKADLLGDVGTPARRDNAPAMSQALMDLINREHKREKANRKHQYFTLGERIMEMYWTHLSYKDEDNDHWHFNRLLGYGGFGVAALYEKYDNYGDIIDSIALKSEIASKSNALSKDDDGMMVLSREVWNHAQIMDRDCHSNLLLYGFKYHFCDNSMATKEEWPERPEAGWLAKSRPFFQEWRTYLEFGVLETINNLMLKYKAWGYHLPEAFIWWMFYWLLESCQSLEAQSNHRFADAANNDMHPETYMLHNDMSHYNFYMQAPYENDMYHGLPLDSYPMPKMADFGLGQLTRLTSPANRARKIHEGTPAFKSPERRKKENHYSQFYPFGPNARKPPEPLPMQASKKEFWRGRSEREHPIGAQSNLWGVAYIVFLLMTLGDPFELDHIIQAELDDHETHQQERPRGDRRRSSGQYHLFQQVPTNLPKENGDDSAENYSEELMEIVLQCIRLRPQDRPDLQAVRQAVNGGMQHEMARLDAEFDHDQDLVAEKIRVCTSDSEWNIIPRGPCNFGIDLQLGHKSSKAEPADSFWFDFHEYCATRGTKDPDASTLVPPHPNSCFITDLGSGQTVVGDDLVTYVSSSDMRYYHNGQPLAAGGRAQNPRKAQARQLAKELSNEKRRLAIIYQQIAELEDAIKRTAGTQEEQTWINVLGQAPTEIAKCEATISNLESTLQRLADTGSSHIGQQTRSSDQMSYE